MTGVRRVPTRHPYSDCRQPTERPSPRRSPRLRGYEAGTVELSSFREANRNRSAVRKQKSRRSRTLTSAALSTCAGSNRDRRLDRYLLVLLDKSRSSPDGIAFTHLSLSPPQTIQGLQYGCKRILEVLQVPLASSDELKGLLRKGSPDDQGTEGKGPSPEGFGSTRALTTRPASTSARASFNCESP